MAYKDSSEIATDQSYVLGEYSFRIERSSVPGSSNDKIEAICTKGGKNARKSIQIPSVTNFDGYYVEANGDTADVYILVESEEGTVSDLLPPGGSVTFVTDPVNAWGSGTPINPNEAIYLGLRGTSGGLYNRNGSYAIVFASSEHKSVNSGAAVFLHCDTMTEWTGNPGTIDLGNYFTYQGKTVWYNNNSLPGDGIINGIPITRTYSAPDMNVGMGPFAWTMVYGTPLYGGAEQILVGRFAIDLEDAGGVGPGSDWYDPGDYDDDWEPGDPTYTLNVEIDGALSGRHNDPLNDTSYSYIPADKNTAKDYGCGGDGGNGGGGGAGASSIVVYKFATDRANSKEIVCKPKRHGYGSGGGKGGKGGDGCILVYY